MPNKIEIIGMKEFRSYLDKFPVKVKREVARENQTSAKMIENHYRQNISQNFVSGDLKNSISSNSIGGNYLKGAEVGSDVLQSIFIEFGTKPHTIKPKKPGGLLIFYWDKIGGMAYAKKVRHPGTKANNSLYRAYVDAMGMGGELYSKRIEQRLKNLK